MVIITYANKVINKLSENFTLSEKTCLQMPKSMV